MSGGMFHYLTEAGRVQEFVGCDFDMALEIVKAAYDYDVAQETLDNVIRVDFQAKRRL
jgi:hypothetical protein